MKVDRRTPGRSADGFFRIARQPLRGACGRRFHDGFPARDIRHRDGALFVPGKVPYQTQLQDHDRRQRLLDGLQPGLHRRQLPRRSAVWGSSWAPTSTSGRSIRGVRSEGARISTCGNPCSWITPTIRRAEFPPRSFGNITKIDNTWQVKNSESFFSVAAGMPLAHRGVFLIRANGGPCQLPVRFRRAFRRRYRPFALFVLRDQGRAGA